VPLTVILLSKLPPITDKKQSSGLGFERGAGKTLSLKKQHDTEYYTRPRISADSLERPKLW
jgi:hypothetical protein